MNTKLVVSILILVGGLLIATSAQAQVAISEEGVIFPDGAEPVLALKQYAVGDIGPAGGFVFYVTDDGLHGLEAAPEDNSAKSPWGCWGTEIPGADYIMEGMGARNTDDIIRSCNELDEPSPAAAAAFIFNTQGYSERDRGYLDWFLPSIDELSLMHENLTQEQELYGFADDIYWSSSEFNANFAYIQVFGGGTQGINDKRLVNRVRAIRAF